MTRGRVGRNVRPTPGSCRPGDLLVPKERSTLELNHVKMLVAIHAVHEHGDCDSVYEVTCVGPLGIEQVEAWSFERYWVHPGE